jgi:NAD+ synthase
MIDELKIMLAQLNPTVGALTTNAGLARKAHEAATRAGADLLVFPELFMSGYPPEDLVLKPSFVSACMVQVKELAELTRGDDATAMLMTSPWAEDGKLYNAAMLLDGGEVAAVRYKHDLPNYGVFDEKRVFDAGPAPGPINFRGVRIGVPICEDIWTEETCETLEETGAELFIVPNGSPFERDKQDVRLNLVVARVTETGLPMIYLNQVGGQDELVFDGASFVLNADRSLACQMPEFEEGLAMTRWKRDGGGWVCESGDTARQLVGYEEIWHACVLGTRDYVKKNRFDGVVLGLSGGIDSAVVAAMAVDALGPDKVHCVMLPYDYTSSDSIEDARVLRQGAGRALRHGADPGARQGLSRCTGANVRRHHRRRDGRKPPVAHPRRHPDGALQQVRLNGADHWQQVGNVSGLCHALWRHERRLQPDQGRLQDRRLRAGRHGATSPMLPG